MLQNRMDPDQEVKEILMKKVSEAKFRWLHEPMYNKFRFKRVWTEKVKCILDLLAYLFGALLNWLAFLHGKTFDLLLMITGVEQQW